MYYVTVTIHGRIVFSVKADDEAHARQIALEAAAAKNLLRAFQLTYRSYDMGPIDVVVQKFRSEQRRQPETLVLIKV